MILKIITIISGLAIAGFYLKSKEILKRKSFHHWIPIGLFLCMLIFILSVGRTVIGILESFYPIWIAHLAAMGITVVSVVVLVKLSEKLFDKRLETLKLAKGEKGD